ncbi:hypothetical protein [Sinorhizobium sp. CCBAU 05631]|uniref:hypothetical protein n=1 Tax=Sinorhizobium sp. CCBAU 05631 TaxID=794846 RepID=UPI0004AC96DA|nr:hypothetical protein [Sinorhizobium sp. CCBAU 05631]ASY61370.1 hypothetical protein SS05631_d64690 [Sinorhizobium sp. CCBAU 05631]
MQSYLFHISGDGSLSEMLPRAYDNEDHIQRLLAEHPAILGGQYNGQEPRRWALIQREVPVPDGTVSDRRWSLDHLYVDQDAIPTLVEVKRSRDTRSRREVVGQMFDYAANGPSYWSLSDLRDAFAVTNKKASADPAEVLRLLLGEQVDVEIFWSQVEDNLRNGRIRMIFLVDEMPEELLRIVEFLARQLRDAEVYAVEVRQHVGTTGQVLATNILGQTQNDQQKISKSRTATTLSEEEWFEAFRARHGESALAVARKISRWASDHHLTSFITTAQTPSMGWSLEEGERRRYPLFIAGNGKVLSSLGYLAYSPAFASEDSRQDLVDRFRTIGLPFSLTSLAGDIRIPVKELEDEEKFRQFMNTVDYVVERLRKGAG